MRWASSLLTFVFPVALAATVGCSSTPPPKVPFPRCPEATPGEPPTAVIDRFYRAFSRKDYVTMTCAYHPDVEFTDSIFGTLHGKRAVAMWAMLMTQSERPLDIKWSEVSAEGTHGRAHWVARYVFPFGPFDNDVVNDIHAEFEFKDGKIWRHKDTFDLDKWMHQALSPMGGIVSQSSIREKVQARLNEFIENNPAYR